MPAVGEAAPRPGEVLAVDATGSGSPPARAAVVVAQLQRAGGRRLAVADFIRGHRIEPGDLLT